jgi:hypothetical protein
MFVPGVNDIMFAQARTSVSWTRSSAVSPFRQSEMAKARRRGIAASMAFPTVGSNVRTCLPAARGGEAETGLDLRSVRTEIVCIDRLDSVVYATPASSLINAVHKRGLPVFAGIVVQLHK